MHALGLAELGGLERQARRARSGLGRTGPLVHRIERTQSCIAAWCGDFEAATAIIAEFDAVNEATGIGWYSSGGLLHAAYQGRPEALALMAASAADSVERGAGHGSQLANWTRAILCNGLGRYADALAAAEQAAYEMEIPDRDGMGAARTDRSRRQKRQPDVAREAMEQLPKQTLDELRLGGGHRGTLASAW